MLALSPVASATADQTPPTLQLTWNALSPTAQKSGEQFTYLASLSCQSLSGAVCTDVVMTIPYATTAPQHPATTPIARWDKSVSASINGVSVPSLSFDDTGSTVVVAIGELKPGEQANVTLRVVPPARTTAGGTAWTAGLEVTSSNAPPTSASAVEMSAEAAFRPAVSKSLVGLAAGARVLTGSEITYRLALGDVTGGAIGSVGLDPDSSVQVTDVLPPELEFVSCSDDCSTDGQTITWSVAQSKVPLAVTVTASVRADAPVAHVFRNRASAQFTSLIGESATVSSNSVEAVVADAPDPHDVFRKEAVGNIGDTTPSALGHITSQRTSSYLLKVIGQPSAFEYVIRDPLPCVKEGDMWVSLPRSSSDACADPAFVVSSVKVDSEGPGVTFPRAMTLVYADGSSQAFEASRSGETFDIPAGKKLARVEAQGSLAAGAGTVLYTLTGKPAPFAAADRFTNIAGFTIPGSDAGGMVDLSAELDTHAKIGAAIGWQQTPPSSADLTFGRMADLDPASEGAGYNWSYVGWWPQFFSSPEERAESGAAAIILPAGFKIAERNIGKLGITEGWGGAEHTRYLLPGRYGNVTGAGGPAFNIVIDRENAPAPGLHTFDMFIGFRDTTFDECLLMDGKVEKGNSLISDTSGIIGSTEGVETSLCHLQGTMLVLGDDPGIALNKSVRSALSPQWNSAPETVVEIGDDGIVDFLLAWSNPGAVEVQDAVIYDIFSRDDDDRTVAGLPRGSTLSLSLAEEPVVPDGWTVEYSVAGDPCRPEIRSAAEEVGCVDDWKPSVDDIATATGIRLSKSTPAAIGDTALVALSFTAPPVHGAVAYNTAASSVKIGTRGDALIPLAPLETPRVGALRVFADPIPDPEPEPVPEPEEKAPPPQPTGGAEPKPDADELALTGQAGLGLLVALAVTLFVGGGGVLAARRLRARG